MKKTFYSIIMMCIGAMSLTSCADKTARQLFTEGCKYHYDAPAKAAELYAKAAEKGNIPAMFNLGQAYFNGRGVEKDEQKAIEWYTKAAERGDEASILRLGTLYETKDPAEAAKWYAKGAEKGDADCQACLADMYYDGRGVKQDYGEAIKLYTQIIEKSDPAAMMSLGGHMRIKYRLGLCYFNGQGVEKNKEKAIELWRQSAEGGYDPAIQSLKELGITGYDKLQG